MEHEKAAERLNKDRDALLTVYDFPTEHWKHLRTTTPSIARSAPCLITRPGREAACRAVPRSPGSSISATLHGKVGEASRATNQLPKLILDVKCRRWAH